MVNELKEKVCKIYEKLLYQRMFAFLFRFRLSFFIYHAFGYFRYSICILCNIFLSYFTCCVIYSYTNCCHRPSFFSISNTKFIFLPKFSNLTCNIYSNQPRHITTLNDQLIHFLSIMRIQLNHLVYWSARFEILFK